MYVIENAFFNIFKNKGRNILLAVVIISIIAATVVSLGIYNTASSIISEYKAHFGSAVTITPKGGQAVTSGGRSNVSSESISAEQYISFAESDYLMESLLHSSVGCFSDNVTAVDQSENKNSAATGTGRNNIGGDLSNATMRLRGDYWIDFENKERDLAEGRLPVKQGECIISTELADLNGLTVGSYFTATSVLLNQMNEETYFSYELEIVGIYYDATEAYAARGISASYQNRRNEILTNFDTIAESINAGLSGIAVNAAYTLKSPDLLKPFEAELRSKGLGSNYAVSTDEASYKAMISPVAGLQSIALTFLVIVIVLGAVIMILLAVISIRERKYEIGVLRAMGMKKKKVALGLWAELVMITSVCFVIGMTVGAAVVQPVSDSLLAAQVENVTPKSQGGRYGSMNSNANTVAAPMDELDVNISPVTALEIFGIAFVLASVAGLVSVGRITKYEPIKILMERN